MELSGEKNLACVEKLNGENYSIWAFKIRAYNKKRKFVTQLNKMNLKMRKTCCLAETKSKGIEQNYTKCGQLTDNSYQEHNKGKRSWRTA